MLEHAVLVSSTIAQRTRFQKLLRGVIILTSKSGINDFPQSDGEQSVNG